ncbi:uncharacterized protein LOC126655150 [Mercurialis annua]|uniref:uncharacterized protein LOC126655150 n=1 Tax=Mercurialis annua TaxID=3986 RepID=UPI00215FB5C0|nr:uncharacterized protein LOC126655150 [Mercurialis annua]
MAKVACKHLLLVVLFILCFMSIGARARILRVANNGNEVGNLHQDLSSSSVENKITVPEPEPAADAEELVGMDYTAPRKKPPIHN